MRVPRVAAMPPSPPRSALRVRLVPEASVKLPAAQSGAHNVVLSWLESADAAVVRKTGTIPTTSILRLVRRATIHKIALGAEAVLEVAPTEPVDGLVAVAILDLDRTFWQTVLAGGAGLIGAAAGPADGPWVEIVLRRSGATADQGAGTREATDRHLVKDVSSGLSCHIAVRPLDDGGVSQDQPFQTIYLLPGLGGTDVGRLHDADFLAGCRRLVAPHKARWLLVSVDTSTAYGTHYLSDRSVYDGWLRLLTERLVAAVDSRYRTIADPRARVLAGHSAGGLNAVQVAMRSPGFFGTVLASAPDPLDLERWLLDADGTVKRQWCAWMRLEQGLGGQGQMLSYACSWSPAQSSRPQWPCDLDTGHPHPAVLAAWLAASPSSLLDRPPARDALSGLQGRLVIGAARNDEFELTASTVSFGERLDGLGIDHRLLLDDVGHFDGSLRLLRLLDASGALDLQPEVKSP